MVQAEGVVPVSCRDAGGVARRCLPILFTVAAAAVQAGLVVEDLGKTYTLDPAVTPGSLHSAGSDTGGSTSLRNVCVDSLRWKTQGYYQRNRDLGQVFNVAEGERFLLDAVVLRTGNSSAAILPGTPGAELFLQIFEVVGTPSVNDNGTPPGTRARHGFTTNHGGDDFIEGVTYKSLVIATGGRFPRLAPTTADGGQEGHLRYLRFRLTGSDRLLLEGGRRYAFMVGFTTPAPGQGFTLGNRNHAAAVKTTDLLTDRNGRAWWGIRREGDGTLPPAMAPGSNPPPDETLVARLKNASMFAPNRCVTLQPTSDGYPDVDTYRTFEFYTEGRPHP